MTDDTEMQQRLSEMEVRFVHQEQALQDLSDMTAQQWEAIEALSRQVERLTDRLENVEQGGGATSPDDEKPPHY